MKRLDYHIDRIEQAADEWRHAAYASYQAATRCRLRMRRANITRAAALFTAAIAAGVTGVWAGTAGTLAYASGWQL